MPKKFGVYSHSKQRAKQGGTTAALSQGHALTDELKLLLPVVHTCPPIGEVTGITESPYNTDRLRVVVGAAQFREAHQQGRGLGRV